MAMTGPWPLRAAILATSAIAATLAVAAPLDPESCARLKSELSGLATARADYAKGAAWAKANLPPARLSEVDRFLRTEEQYLFRCPQPKRQIAAEEDDDTADAKAAPDAKAKPKVKTKSAEAKPSTEAGTEPAAKPKPKPKPKPAVAEGGSAPATSPGPSADAATAPAKPRPKPKPKADDAFSPSVTPPQPPGPQQ